MIACIFHEGSGLGNQLHRYVMARVLARDLGCEFGTISPENFKGSSFMKLDMGVPVKNLFHEFKEEKVINQFGNDIRGYDKRISEIKDFTLIDGEFQGENYFKHRFAEVDQWLGVEPLEMPEDLCILNFRGGEYVGVKDLFLPQRYWYMAMYELKQKHPKLRFAVVTDDMIMARYFFPNLPITHEIGNDWRSIRYAKWLILSNSSFCILPALLNTSAHTIIAPKFWAGYNKGYWQLEQNKYERFEYVHYEN